MLRPLLSLALVAALSTWATPPLFGHGGVYRGPGATVGPGGATKGGPSSNSGGFVDTDPAAWSQWWSFNRDRYLAVRDAVFTEGSAADTGLDDFFLGKGAKGQMGPDLRPTEEVLHRDVVPALLETLDGQRDVDLITACLLALAKIGDRADGTPGVAAVIRPWLEHGNQEVHETAAIALGVLGQSESAPLLADLLLDKPAGRKASGRGRVPVRTQAFAAYGLALVGFRARPEAVRSFVVHHLAQAISLGDKPSRDRMVAAIIGMGIVRLRPLEGAPDPEEIPRVGGSRDGQLAFLLELWDDRRLDPRVKAHMAVPLARLASGADPMWKARLVAAFRETIAAKTSANPMEQHGVLLAAGIIGDNDQDPDDQRLRASLFEVVSDGGDRLARHLALLAIGRVCAREGTGTVDAAPAEARALLMRILSRGKTAQRPWAALGVGLLERGNVAAGHPPAEGTRLALIDAFDKAATPSEQGALATALGLIAERRATDALIERVTNGDENLRANAMISLGLMNAQKALPVLRGVVGLTTYNPGIVREAAIALALLGDKTTGPSLVARLTRANMFFEQLAVTWALGYVGDARVLAPLVTLLTNKRENDTTRAYAAVALGAIGDKELFPWNSKIAADVLWWQAPPTLFDASGGKGILDIL